MGSDGSFDSDLSKVTSAIQHALFARYPKYRYPVGRGSVALFWTLTKLPEIVADRMFAAAAPWYRLLENMICGWFKIILITAIYYIYTHTISCRTVAPREIRVSGNPTFPPSYSSAASTRWKYMNTTCMFTDIINSNIRTCIFTHTLIKARESFHSDLQSTDIFIRFDWFYKSISKKMFNRKEVGYKFFFALYHNEARPVIFGSMVTFFLTIWLMIQSKYQYIVS